MSHSTRTPFGTSFTALVSIFLLGTLLAGCIGSMDDALQGAHESTSSGIEGPAGSPPDNPGGHRPTTPEGREEIPGPSSEQGPSVDEVPPRDEPGMQRPGARTRTGWKYEVLPPTIMMIDTGINPYHVDYRLPEGFNGRQEGYYPDDAVLVDLALDAGTLQEALEEDEEIWESLEAGVLYAFNGTRIAGAIQPQPCPNHILEECPSVIFDEDGHGSAVASAAAGRRAGSCPDCRIVMVYGSIQESTEWALQQEWIDALSVSYADFNAGMTWANVSAHWTEGGRTWFHSAGNGATNSLNPANVVAERSSGDNVLVGSIVDGEIQPLHSRIYDLLGVGRKEGARIDHLAEYKNTSGTSIASPDAMGHYAWILWQVRQALGDTIGFQNGVLARAPADLDIPSQGPLADGELTARELEDALRATAKPVPPVQGGPQGGALSYLWAGYGLVDNESREHAVRVILGEEQMPEREWENWWHETLDHVREPYFTYVVCIHHLFTQGLGSGPAASLECAQESYWEPQLPNAPPVL